MTTSPSLSAGTLASAVSTCVLQHGLGLVGLALGVGLADAEDRLEVVLERHDDLRGERFVGLVEVLTALGVTEHDGAHVEVAQHACGDLAGVGAGFGLVHVLRGDLDARAARGVDHV